MVTVSMNNREDMGVCFENMNAIVSAAFVNTFYLRFLWYVCCGTT